MKVGIIGCGGIAPSHIQAFQSLDIEVVGLCDLDLARVKNLATKYKVENIYEDYWTMFEKEDLDLVDICTPTSTHEKIVSDAVKRVPAIFLEKPMAMNVSECDEIIKQLKKYGAKFCVGHNQIFHPNVQKAKYLVESEKFDLLSFNTSLKASFDILREHDLAPPWNVTPNQKGIIWEVGCHHAYLQLHFLPDITEVYAIGNKAKYPVYDNFMVLLRTKGEPYGFIEISWLCKEFEVIYELKDYAGKRIQLHWLFDYVEEKSQYPPLNYGGVIKNIIVDEKRLLHKWTRFTKQYIKKRKSLPLLYLLGSYINAIENDLPSPVSAEDGRKTVNLLECIEKSLNEKKPIHLNN